MPDSDPRTMNRAGIFFAACGDATATEVLQALRRVWTGPTNGLPYVAIVSARMGETGCFSLSGKNKKTNQSVRAPCGAEQVIVVNRDLFGRQSRSGRGADMAERIAERIKRNRQHIREH